DIEVVDIHCECARPLQHDWQAINGYAGGEDVVPRDRDERAAVVGTIPRDVDDTPGAAITAGVEKGLAKVQRARNRGARGAPIRRACDFVSAGGGSLGAVR